jgi:hypothetical protein
VTAFSTCGRIGRSGEPSVPGTTYQLTAAQAKMFKPGRGYSWYVASVSTNGKCPRGARATFTL